MTHRRPLALAAAAIIALGSLAFTSPAFADEDLPVAPITENTVPDPGSDAGEADAGASGTETPDTEAPGSESSDTEASGSETSDPARGTNTGTAATPGSAAAPQVAGPEFAELTVDGFTEAPIGVFSAPLTSLSGTGEPGAAIEIQTAHISLDELMGGSTEEPAVAQYEVAVGADGTWELQLSAPMPRGMAFIGVMQNGDDDQDQFQSLQALLFDPMGITSIGDGEKFTVGTAPSSVSGTFDPAFLEIFGPVPEAETLNLEGLGGTLEKKGFDADSFDFDTFSAEISGAAQFTASAAPAASAAGDFAPSSGLLDATLSFGDGQTFPVLFDGEGNWRADFDGPLPVGAYSLTVTPVFNEPFLQEINRMSSTSVQFSVSAESAAGGTAGGSGAGAAGSVSAGTGGETIAHTGSGSPLPFVLGAAALLLAGGAALTLARRRAAQA